jgi:lipopolysaccharide heptosyltransferase II
VAPNILIVRFSSIGDLILTTPLLRAIRTRHPEARITFVVREDMADTLRHNPRITRLITWRRGTPLGVLAAELRKESWTHRLDLHGSLRSMALRLRVGGRWTTYPKHRLRRKLLIMSHRRLGGSLDHVADRYFHAARGLDVTPDGGPPEFFTTAAAEAEVQAMLAAHHVGEGRPLIAVASGAAHFTQRWPERHWRAFLRELGAGSDVVVLGGKAEERFGAELASAARGRSINVAGLFTHDQNGALLKRAAVLVGGDTGLLHLATAVGTPVVGLYGPTVEEFGFFPYHAVAAPVQLDLDCRPCSSQGGPACPLGHHRCLEQLEPAAVRQAAERMVALVRGPTS